MRRMIICEECGKKRPHEAKGLCQDCYLKEYSKKYRQTKSGKEKISDAQTRYFQTEKGKIANRKATKKAYRKKAGK